MDLRLRIKSRGGRFGASPRASGPRRSDAIRWAAVLSILVALVGCGPTQLMPSPNLYVNQPAIIFEQLPESMQSSSIDVLYATDRGSSQDADGKVSYGVERSRSLAFGSCVVEIGRGLSWDQLVTDSTTAHRPSSLPLRMISTTPLGVFPATPSRVVRDDDGVHLAPEVKAEFDRQLAAFQGELSRRLQIAPRKDVLIFVHGFNNSLEDAAVRTAELHHFLGREFVPVVYSWPAGAGGLLRGYTRDTESADFSVHHFKCFLRAVADCPEVERIHIISHSRGNVLTTSAIRELFLEAGGVPAAQKFRDRFKLHDWVLAAADLDLEVAEQRMAAEGVGLGAHRITVYNCGSDRALGLSDWLFGGLARVGQVQSSQYDLVRDDLPNLRGLTLINARIKGGFLSHAYFLDSPAVSSDLILTLRYDRDAGAENGRPLKRVLENYWEVEDGYPVFETTPANAEKPVAASP